MKKILIVSGHPDLNDSFANKTILEETKKLLPEAEFVYLDKLYPDFCINVQAEQECLLRADIIVLQYPLFWYSAPSLLHRWMEQTFTHGFSHGRTGDKLRGKQLVLSFTSGAPEEMYRYDGPQHYPIDDFLPAYKQMANLCGMEWCGYVYSGRTVVCQPPRCGRIGKNERKGYPPRTSAGRKAERIGIEPHKI